MLTTLFFKTQGPLCHIFSFLSIFELTTTTCLVCKAFYESCMCAIFRNIEGFSRSDYFDMFINKGIKEGLLLKILSNSKTFDKRFVLRVNTGINTFPLNLIFYCTMFGFKRCIDLLESQGVMKIKTGEEFAHAIRFCLFENNLEKFKRIVQLYDPTTDNAFYFRYVIENNHPFPFLKVITERVKKYDNIQIPPYTLVKACYDDNYRTLDYLLSQNWFKNPPKETCDLIIKYCSQFGYVKCLNRISREKAADLCFENNFALKRACKYGKTEVVRFLLDRKEVVDSANSYFVRLYNECFKLNHLDILAIFESKGFVKKTEDSKRNISILKGIIKGAGKILK